MFCLYNLIPDLFKLLNNFIFYTFLNLIPDLLKLLNIILCVTSSLIIFYDFKQFK